MSNENSTTKIWPLPVIVAVSLTIFAATFFTYAERYRLHEEGSLFPAVAGVGIFIVAMLILTALMLPKERRNAGLIVGIVAGETLVFVFVFMFLLLNIFGS